MLTDLQRHLVALVAELDRDHRFAVAGAGALIAVGVIPRVTADVDFFATSAADVDALAPRLRDALATAGYAVAEVQVSSGFVRLDVRRGTERCLADLGYDARDWPTQPNPAGRLGRGVAKGPQREAFDQAGV